MSWSRRVASILLVVVVAAGNAAVCAGWAPTPEARMACCSEGATCPMHKSEPHHTAAGHGLTQAQADTCCALSERGNSSQSSQAYVSPITIAVLGTGIVLPATVPSLVLSDAWRTVTPIPRSAVPKHVLLSVFLV